MSFDMNLALLAKEDAALLARAKGEGFAELDDLDKVVWWGGGWCLVNLYERLSHLSQRSEIHEEGGYNYDVPVLAVDELSFLIDAATRMRANSDWERALELQAVSECAFEKWWESLHPWNENTAVYAVDDILGDRDGPYADALRLLERKLNALEGQRSEDKFLSSASRLHVMRACLEFGRQEERWILNEIYELAVDEYRLNQMLDLCDTVDALAKAGITEVELYGG